jgi:hypothetical protein
MKQKHLHHNPVSYAGGLIVAASVTLILLTVAFMLILGGGSPYFGIVAFLLLPMFVVLGLLVFFYGMRRESLRRRRLGTSEAPPYPRVDLNDPRQRRRFGRAAVAAVFLLILLAVTGYHGFLFTESVTFCGRICHTVMEPEFTAYQASPHARVSCVECHVGSGADWYVKSKLSGVRQVFAVLFHTYETPIPVPIKNLRPARETCEECHWPQKFYGAQLIRNPHFRYDEANTAEQITFLVKTGGGSPKLGQNAGIHFHMIIENQITFAAADAQQQVIPWVSVRHADGTVLEYVASDTNLAADQLAKLPRRTMDCMDCHNRPTHVFLPPEGAVDTAMASGLISPALPWIKKVAVDALVREYPDHAAAERGITEEITSFYAANYPSVAAAQQQHIAEACETVVAIYRRSVFPKMNVNWRSYASNIGHRNWPGCFRCHDGQHVAANGRVLTKDCAICHTLPQRGPLAPIGAAVPEATEAWHPMELEGKHATILCNRCHAAGFRPPTECATCHRLDPAAPMMASGCDTCHARSGQVQPLADCTSCHDTLSGLHRSGGHPDAACTDCHQPHRWQVTGRDACLACHDDKASHYQEEGDCANCHDFTR